ncbi:hypothetical protein GBA52_029050 [Prunus armeniaca]|nr:hypothetical protein GBA52_029050 [Prunus armeniaca]
MKDHVMTKAQVEETPKLRLIQAFFALHEEIPVVSGMLRTLWGKWWQLPQMSVHARIPLLQQFQQLVEVQESSRILVDIANGNKLSGNSIVGGARKSVC